MSRNSADLIKPWKLTLPATLAGRVEYALHDPVHNKPRYGARNRLIVALLEYWLAREAGKTGAELPPIPFVEELRNL